MRFSNVILGVFSVGVVGLIGAGPLAGCGGDTGGTGGEGASTSSSSSSGTASSSSGATFPCSLGAACKAVDKECVGLTDNAGKTKFGLRMAQLDVTKPTVLSTGAVAGIVSGAVKATDAACNLTGLGTFSWLLEFDTTAGTLKTGGAKPVTDPSAGYSFVDEMLDGVQVSPIVFDAKPDAAGAFAAAAPKDIIVPIFLDAAATNFVLLPLKQAKFSMGTLSASQNCVGKYNAENLDPENACDSDDKAKSFITAAKLDGMITLEDADKVEVSSVQATLCVLLANNMGVDGPAGYKVCARDANMKITYQGDACSTGTGCGDAVSLAADFAASSVVIK